MTIARKQQKCDTTNKTLIPLLICFFFFFYQERISGWNQNFSLCSGCIFLRFVSLFTCFFIGYNVSIQALKGCSCYLSHYIDTIYLKRSSSTSAILWILYNIQNNTFQVAESTRPEMSSFLCYQRWFTLLKIEFTYLRSISITAFIQYLVSRKASFYNNYLTVSQDQRVLSHPEPIQNSKKKLGKYTLTSQHWAYIVRIQRVRKDDKTHKE